MTNPIVIRMGGYGPPTTGFSQVAEIHRRPARESSSATASTSSIAGTSWISATRPRRSCGWSKAACSRSATSRRAISPTACRSSSFVDLPFLFDDNDQARGRDGRRARPRASCRRSRARRTSASSAGSRTASAISPTASARSARPPTSRASRIRVLPSQIQARTFELLGATPMIMDLTDAIRMIKAGEIDAQENPLTNTVTYGVHKFHRFHTISNHFYISRPIFLHRPTFDAWPDDLKAAMQQAVDGLGRVPARPAREGGGGRRARDQGRGLRDRRRSTPSSTTPSPRRCSRSTPRRASSWATSCSNWLKT